MEHIAKLIAMALIVPPAAATLSGCSGGDEEAAEIYTLYRTGPNTPRARIRWATFESYRRAERNKEDCEMTARIMTANMDAFAEKTGAPQFGQVDFWCEAGAYSTEGENPADYTAEFPSNTRIRPRVGE